MNKMEFVKKTAVGLALATCSMVIFFIVAEYLTRWCDANIAKTKIHKNIDDGGLRFAGYSRKKPKGVYRILVLGDSIAYGQGVHKDHTFSKQLENLLNEGRGKKKFEVINTGFQGIDTTQELGILLNRGPDARYRPELPGQGWVGLAYEPDFILLQYTVSNDAQYYGPGGAELHPPHRWRDGVRRYNHGDYALPLPENIDRWLTKHSRFYLFFLNKYNGFLSGVGLRDHSKRVIAMYNSGTVGWIKTRRAIWQIGKIAEMRQFPAMMVIWSTNNDTPFKEVHPLIRDAGLNSGFQVLDLAADVTWPKKSFAVSKSDGHPNAEAHGIAAEAIFKFIKEKELITGLSFPGAE